MRAMVFEGPGCLRLAERETPRPIPGEVLIQVRASGICGTDRHIYHGEFPAVAPVILGHEFAGQVVAIGDGVPAEWLGRRVAVDPNIACGRCAGCREGRPQLCTSLQAVGVTRDGGFAEYCAVPLSQAFVLPDHLSWEEAALAEPVACCVHGLDLAGIRAGQTVAVLGGGAIGLILAQLARAQGAARVVVSEPAVPRRQVTGQLGLEAVPPDLLATTLAEGAHVVIEAVGAAQTAAQALDIVRPGGTVLFFGVAPIGARIQIEPFQVYKKELTIRGSALNPFTQERAIALLAAGTVRVQPLLTHRCTLTALPEILATPAPPEMVKAMVVFSG
jgi:2-desacetyl-2-hydroxyethyl bacteriochlorophyllide A dehydrogenase